MKGIVKYVDKSTGRTVLQTDDGYTVFDIHSEEVNIGDTISGNLNDLGSNNLFDQTTGHTLHVYIEATQADLVFARSLLRH